MTEADQKTYDEVMKKWTRINNALTSTFKRYNDLEDLYFFHTPKNKNSAKSNVFDPMAYEQVEHTVSHLFSNEPKGSFVPVGMDELKDVNLDIVLAAMDELIKQQWNKRDADMFRKIATTLRRAALYGVGWATQTWRYERIQDPITNKWVTVWDDWCVYPHSNYDVWPDIDAQTYKEMEFCIVDEYTTYDDLEATKGHKGEDKRYTNLTELKKMLDETDSSINTSNGGNPYRNNMMVRRKIDTAGQMDGRVKVRHCYYKDRWVSICPDYNLLIEDGKNLNGDNKLPIRCLLDQDIPGLVLGIGEVDPVRTLMMAMNQFINMRMDNIKMNMERPLVAKFSAIQHLKTWIWKRNNIMIQNQEGDIKPLEVQDITGNTFISTLTWLQGVIRTRSGRSDILTTNRGNKTATEIDAVAEEQNARLKYKANNFDEFIREIMVGGMKLNQRFLKNDRFLRIIGSENIAGLQQKFAQDPERLNVINDSLAFLKMGPDDILNQYDYIVETGSTLMANNTRDIQNLTQALSLGQTYNEGLMMNGKVFNPSPAIKKIFLKMGIKDEVIKDAPPPPPPVEEAVEPPPLPPQPKMPSESLSYKDAPPFIKAQIEEQAGMQPDPIHSLENKFLSNNLINPPIDLPKLPKVSK